MIYKLSLTRSLKQIRKAHTLEILVKHNFGNCFVVKFPDHATYSNGNLLGLVMSSNLLLEYSILGWTRTPFYSLHLSNKKNISRFKDTKLIKDCYFQVTLVQPLSLQCSINSSNLCWLFPINSLICSFL